MPFSHEDAEAYLRSLRPRDSLGAELDPSKFQIGSHFKARDSLAVTRMAQKSEPPPLNTSQHNALHNNSDEELATSLLTHIHGPSSPRVERGVLKDDLSTDRQQDVRSGHHFSRKFGQRAAYLTNRHRARS